MLAVGISVVGAASLKGQTPKTAVAKNSLDPALPSSWMEIHPDNTVVIRTGKNDFGQGSVFTAYRQIVAEELSMPFEAITTVVAREHRSNARWRRLVRLSWQRNPESSQGGCVYLSGIA